MNEPVLEEVLEEYAAATPLGNDLKILRLVSEKYPQFADELADFAAARAVAKHAPEEELSQEEEERVRESGLNNLRSVLASSNTAGALQSLIETAKTKGLNRTKFAARTGLSVSLVQYLEKRRLEFASIPPKIISRIAEVLETAEDAVAKYLKQLPVAATNASFKTMERPVEVKPKSFAEAVREDQKLSPKEKRKLLEL